jgi:anti-sigma B factor antagonist
VETAIGVFSSRDRAEEAVRELIKANVPQESVVFLTRSETEVKAVGKELGGTVFKGALTGLSAGAIAASVLLVPGIGVVFGLGIGAAALLGLIGAEASSAGRAAADTSENTPQITEGKLSEDAVFFREVLKEGRSLIVVRTESQETVKAACGILDQLGLGIQGRSPAKMQTATRQVADITIVDVVGRITLGEGNVMLREMVREMLEKGNKKILLNLQGVGYVDSSGIGELVRTYTTVRNQGGQLKLFNLSNVVHDLLQITKLYAVFDIQADEAGAIQSISGPAASRSSA